MLEVELCEELCDCPFLIEVVRKILVLKLQKQILRQTINQSLRTPEPMRNHQNLAVPSIPRLIGRYLSEPLRTAECET